MQISELIDAAKKNSGQSLGELARELGRNQTRISEWKKGERTPDANEIAFFAKKARLAVLETLAEIEMSLHPEFANLWQEAVSEIRQNQGLSQIKKFCRSVARKLQPKQRRKRKARKGPFLLVKKRP